MSLIVAGWAWDDRALAVFTVADTTLVVLFTGGWFLILAVCAAVAELLERRERRRIDRAHLRVRPFGRERDVA